MTVETKFPGTLQERLELGPGIVRLPASWVEYVDLLQECEYQIEYENQHIILMSIATNPHEAIVSNIIIALGRYFQDDDNLLILSSNRHVFSKEFKADYAPDAHVVKGKPVEHTLREGLTANLNPRIVFEVLSPSTRERDWNEKLPVYKKFPSVQQIIYVEQSRPFVSVYTRMDNSERWENVDYDKMEQAFLVEGKPVLLKDLYRKIDFAKPVQ
ncbi:MAG: Uma2 family endonuclease [Saprospiraceae bacterium]|nr:MAG: Uma2 family endonuclease [Saprospiraceae bacterium]